MERGGCIYFLTNAHNTVLYLGVTSDLVVRLNQHKTKEFTNSFTAKYNCNKLVYYEVFHSIEEAIAREKAVKKWHREWKDKLIRKMNPQLEDLSIEVINT
jgi:putative endonuclease